MNTNLENMNIWSKPAYLPYVQKPLTDEILINAETALHIKFPKEYIDLLKIQNGGYIRHRLGETCHEMIAGIGEAFPSVIKNYIDEYESSVSFPVKGLIPFDGDGHWNICFDYRNCAENPKIVYVDTESDYEEPIADSFVAYLEQLSLQFVEGTYVIDQIENIENFIISLEHKFSLTGKWQGKADAGFDSYLGHTKNKTDIITVEPNKVIAVFIRKNKENYNEKKHLMNESSIQFPELPESCYIVGLSENIENDFISFCENFDIKVNPIDDLIECEITDE